MRTKPNHHLALFTRHFFRAGLALLLATAPGWPGDRGGEGPHQVRDLTGAVATHEGQRLSLKTDLGSVRIRVGKADQISYHVQVESDSQGTEAERWLNQFAVSGASDAEGVSIVGYSPSRHGPGHGRLWVTFEVEVPKRYNLNIHTGGGNIVVPDIDGQAELETSGGTINAGRLGGRARLETAGGHIEIQDVGGDLTADTGGGHITAGNVQGSAELHTGGGHIRAGSVKGTARLETGGGNVTLGHAGGQVIAGTGGGQIELGEAAGGLRASTGGGGIRVLRVVGPSDLETGGGSILLTQIGNAIRASTGSGGITAWFAPQARFEASSRLECGQGDIVVYLPRELSITIDAAVEEGTGNTIMVDPAFPLKVTYSDSSGKPNIVHAEGALNGGGKTLRLRTEGGNIRVLLSDAAHYREQIEQFQHRMEMERQRFEHQMQHEHQMQQLQEKLKEKP